MDEDKYMDAMQIILHAGNAKSAALMAVSYTHLTLPTTPYV